MPNTLHIVAISGSLRQASYNTATLKAAMELKPDDMQIEIAGIGDLPLYSEDVEKQGWPEPVARLRKTLQPADGVLISTPEYNYSMPGVLKNAIDWLSRPDGESPIFGKPVGIMGATPSIIGTARAQAHLRQVAYYNAMPLLASSEVLISRAQEKFDRAGRLVHDETRKFLAEFLVDFRNWVRKVGK